MKQSTTHGLLALILMNLNQLGGYPKIAAIWAVVTALYLLAPLARYLGRKRAKRLYIDGKLASMETTALIHVRVTMLGYPIEEYKVKIKRNTDNGMIPESEVREALETNL